MKHNKYSIMIFLRKLNFDKILKEKKRFIVAMIDKVTIWNFSFGWSNVSLDKFTN